MSTALPVPSASIPQPKANVGRSVVERYVVEGHVVTVTGCRRSNWVNWKGEARSCEGEEALVDSGLALPLPGRACQMGRRRRKAKSFCGGARSQSRVLWRMEKYSIRFGSAG